MTPSEHGPVRAVVEAAIVAQSDVGKVIPGTETYITNERKLAAIRAQADALDAARLTWPISDEAAEQLADAWMVEYQNALALTYVWTDERDLKRQIHRATAAAVLRRLAELEAHHDTE